MERAYRMIALAVIFVGCAVLVAGGTIASATPASTTLNSSSGEGAIVIGGLAMLFCGILFGIEFLESRRRDMATAQKSQLPLESN